MHCNGREEVGLGRGKREVLEEPFNLSIANLPFNRIWAISLNG